MLTGARHRNDRALIFGAILRTHLRRKEWGVRTLAREMALRSGRGIEAERRRLNKYLRGDHFPSPSARTAIAAALGIKARELAVDEDDDEDAQRQMKMMRGLSILEDLHEALRAAVQIEHEESRP